MKHKVKKRYNKDTCTVEENWETIRNTVLEAAEEVCGTTKGGKYQERETWWWTEYVQKNTKKKEAFKAWQQRGGQELKEVFSQAKREQWQKLKKKHGRNGMTTWRQRKGKS